MVLVDANMSSTSWSTALVFSLELKSETSLLQIAVSLRATTRELASDGAGGGGGGGRGICTGAQILFFFAILWPTIGGGGGGSDGDGGGGGDEDDGSDGDDSGREGVASIGGTSNVGRSSCA